MRNELQYELDALVEAERLLEEKRFYFTKKAAKHGYHVNGNALAEDGKTWTLGWDLTYFHSYITDNGPLYHQFKGVCAIDVEAYDELFSAFQARNAEKMITFLATYIEDAHYFESMKKGGYFDYGSDGSFKWIGKFGENGGFGDLCHFSIFEVKRMKQEEMNRIEQVSIK